LLEDVRATPRRWWRPVYRELLRAPREQLAEQLRGVLGDVVRSRTPGDEITGMILSGGFDSSARDRRGGDGEHRARGGSDLFRGLPRRPDDGRVLARAGTRR
jgi:hypothetical protein